MATNYSMLSNIAGGIREGMTAYQTAKNQERQERMNGLLHGYTENPDTGEFELTPEMKQEKELKQRKATAELAETDPNSELSKNTQAWAKQNGLLGTEGMSASQIKGLIPIITAKTKGEYAEKAAGVRGAGSSNLADIRRDNQSASAAKSIHDDPVLKDMRAQAVNVEKGMHLISDPNAQPSVTAMHEIAQDFAAALSGKGVASDFKLKNISTPTLQENIKKLESFITSNPNQPAPPEVVAFWKDMGSRLQGAYNDQMSIRAKNKLVGMERAYKHNPDAFASAKEASDLYQNGKWKELEGVEPAQAAAGGGQHPQDSAAVTWAKSNPKDPRAAAILKANGL